MENLMEHLKEHNLNFATIPYVLMRNKRDLPNAMSVADLTKQLQKKGEPVLEGVAIQGLGVFETLKEVAKLVLAELKKGGEQGSRLSTGNSSISTNGSARMSFHLLNTFEILKTAEE